MGTTTPLRPPADTPAAPRPRLIWGAFAVAILIAAIAGIAGSPFSGLALACIAVFTVQGLRKGAARTVGLLLGCFAGLLFAPTLGRILEPLSAGISGSSGLLNRFLSCSLAFVAIAAIVSVTTRALSSRALKLSPRWQSRDRWLGGVLGAVEGSIVVLALGWAIFSVEPLAKAQLAAGEAAEGAGQTGLSQQLTRAADVARRSWFGRLADATNPGADSRLLLLADDFARISRDPESMTKLLASNPVERIAELPSVSKALSQLENDSDIGPRIADGSLTAAEVLAIAESPRLLQILDDSPVIAEVTPHLPDLERVIREIRAEMRAAGKG